MKKKAVFITIHVGFNFGSKLQTIATQNLLKKVGFEEVECVNYIPPRVELKRYWKDSLQSSVKFLRRLLFFPVLIYSLRKYNGYLKRHCNLSLPIYAKDDFNSKCPKADVYITGSDQIWNYKHNEGLDKHYFFDGIEGVKIAYASSIGMTQLPEDYSKYMREKLMDFKAISVREQSAVDLLSDMDIRSTLVPDPTIMLNKEEWKNYASKRLVENRYLFMYLPYNVVDKELIYRSARIIAKEKGLEIVTYSDSIVREKNADKTIYFVDAGDVLSLFYYADTIITNSFHGTAFSINLNKPFWVYKPSSFYTRIANILNLCQLSDRLLENEITINQVNEVIDYSSVNTVLQREREVTLNYFKKALL